ncbi:MAG: hypothetical protein HYU64_18605 [Armatimonadetes bacterium]|nr:hypothetical protein [Armatimonadota bacterium]
MLTPEVALTLKTEVEKILQGQDSPSGISVLYLYCLRNNPKEEEELEIAYDLERILEFGRKIAHVSLEMGTLQELVKGSVDALITDTIRDSLIYFEEFFKKGDLTLERILFDGTAYLLGRWEDYAFVRGSKGSVRVRGWQFCLELEKDLWDLAFRGRNGTARAVATFEEARKTGEAISWVIKQFETLEPDKRFSLVIWIYQLLILFFTIHLLAKLEAFL